MKKTQLLRGIVTGCAIAMIVVVGLAASSGIGTKLENAFFVNSAAPSTPASGQTKIYVDSTSKNLAVKNDAGTVNHGVQTKAVVANQFVTGISDSGAVSAAQPAMANISDLPVLASGTYTPTMTIVANLDSVTPASCQYMRVGSTVTVSGFVQADPTASTTITRFGISLPVASDFANFTECCGVGASASTASTNPITISADITNNRAEAYWYSSATTSSGYYFTFTYRIN